MNFSCIVRTLGICTATDFPKLLLKSLWSRKNVINDNTKDDVNNQSLVRAKIVIRLSCRDFPVDVAADVMNFCHTFEFLISRGRTVRPMHWLEWRLYPIIFRYLESWPKYYWRRLTTLSKSVVSSTRCDTCVCTTADFGQITDDILYEYSDHCQCQTS